MNGISFLSHQKSLRVKVDCGSEGDKNHGRCHSVSVSPDLDNFREGTKYNGHCEYFMLGESQVIIDKY